MICRLYMTAGQLSGIRCNQICPIRDGDGLLLTKLEDQLQQWKSHFESVLNRPTPDQPADPPVTDAPLLINTGQITRGEFKSVLKQLKNGKAVRADNIPPEALKEGGPSMEEILYRVFNLAWKKRRDTY